MNDVVASTGTCTRDGCFAGRQLSVSRKTTAAALLLLLLLLQAFLGGKAACGLTMAAIRCASKAALPGKSMHHLQLGTTVFLAVGALLVALCVVIVGWVLPRLQAGMEVDAIPPSRQPPFVVLRLFCVDVFRASRPQYVAPSRQPQLQNGMQQQPLSVGGRFCLKALQQAPRHSQYHLMPLLLLLLLSVHCPTALTVQQTLIASQSIALGSPVPPRASLLPFSNTLSAMQPGMDGAVLMPVFSASMQPTATGAMSFRLSRMDTHVGLQGHHTSRLLAPMGTLVPAWSNAHRASMRR
jgi:hypothetical protein